MPESPDFDAITEQIVERLDLVGEYVGTHGNAVRRDIAEQLRLVWNARGAADIAKLEAEIPNVWTAAAPAGPLTRAVRSLDR